MEKPVFEYLAYRDYLSDFIASSEGGGHGLRTKMATFANCRSAYISQVLSGVAQLSLEQAEAISRFVGHSDEETDFFLLLVQFDRAGTAFLKNRIRRQMDKTLEYRQTLKNRVDIKKSISQKHQQIYYSSWIYVAIHILATIPGFDQLEKIAAYLSLPREKILEAMSFLTSAGIFKKEGNKLVVQEARIFLGSDSPLIRQHHANWRLKAVSSMELGQKSDVHLSTVFSLSRSDVKVLKEKMLTFIDQTRAVAKESKEEELYSFCLDFFQVK